MDSKLIPYVPMFKSANLAEASKRSLETFEIKKRPGWKWEVGDDRGDGEGKERREKGPRKQGCWCGRWSRLRAVVNISADMSDVEMGEVFL